VGRRTWRARWRVGARWARAVLRELGGLVLPVACAGCGRDDEAWCGACARRLGGEPWRCEDRAGRLVLLDGPVLPVLTVADCVGPVRAALVAWKDRGRRDLTPVLAAVAGRLGSAAAAHVPPLARGTPVLVVPAPSTPAARRARGFAHVDVLADGVARGLRAAGVDARAVGVLRRTGRDQVGLGLRERGRLVGRVRVAPRHVARVRGAGVVLVDDILTSGATLAACVAALAAVGAVPLGGVTLASTPGPARTGTILPGLGDSPGAQWSRDPLGVSVGHEPKAHSGTAGLAGAPRR